MDRYRGWDIDQMRRLTPADSAEDESGLEWSPTNRQAGSSDSSQLPSLEKPTARRAARTKSNSSATNVRIPTTKSKEKSLSNITRKRSGSPFGRVSKRAREFAPERPKSIDDIPVPSYDVSIKKFTVFRHSDSSRYTDQQDISMVCPKTLANDQSTIISERRAPFSSDLELWLLKNDANDPFQFSSFGNNGNRELDLGRTDLTSLSSEASFLVPKPTVAIVEKKPQHPSFSDDPFDDLEDADFSVLELPQQVYPCRPKPTVQPQVQPPPQSSRKPIVRPPFPDAVHGRSLIHGVSAGTVLRTCFRIGEALRAGSRAVHEANDVVIELYARVASSSREDETPASGRQDFRFVDLFHDRPPHLKGVYDLWKGCELWDAESRAFLAVEGQPMLCRCVGKMKRDGKELLLTVYSVRRASWDDVDHAKAIICGP